MTSKHKVEPLVLRPCNGWKPLGCSVWEHTNGIRIHVGGLIKMPSGKFHRLNSVAGGMGWQLVKINGGNRKRGLMAWAMNCISQNAKNEGLDAPEGDS